MKYNRLMLIILIKTMREQCVALARTPKIGLSGNVVHSDAKFRHPTPWLPMWNCDIAINGRIQKFLTHILIGLGLLTVTLFATGNSEEMSVKLPPAKEQFRKWFENESMLLRDGDDNLICLNLKALNNGQDDPALSTKQQVALDEALNWNIEAFCARGFDEYYKAINKVAEDYLKISLKSRGKISGYLNVFAGIKQSELQTLTDYELTEAYWMFISKIGFSSKHFSGLVSRESFYKLKSIRDKEELKVLADPFPNDRKTCGFTLKPSIFLWGDSDPDKEFNKNGELLIADIRYMLKTNVKNLAYPICVRMYWNEKFGKWIPWFCIEYNVSDRYCDMVF